MMWVIEAVDESGAVADIHVTDASKDGTIARPLKCHFTEDRVSPWLGSGYADVESATADLPIAVNVWGHPEYRRYEAVIANARVVPLNSESARCGYVIAGSTDPDIWGKWYRDWSVAFKAWIGLTRKHAQNRIKGECPFIDWHKGDPPC